MKILFLFMLLCFVQLSDAQISPWQPNEVILNERDTFVLVERTEFDKTKKMRWLTLYKYDEKGMTIQKTELDCKKGSFSEELSIHKDNSESDLVQYETYMRQHQDSSLLLASLSSYDANGRVVRKLTYDKFGEVIDSANTLYDEGGFLSQTTWNKSYDRNTGVRREDVSRTRTIHSDSGSLDIATFIQKEFFWNGMESVRSTTYTFQSDLNGNVIEERSYWSNDLAADLEPKFDTNGAAIYVAKRSKDDTLQMVIQRTYDINNNLTHAIHKSSLASEPFYQERYIYGRNGRLIKSFKIDENGVHNSVNLFKYRKRGKNTEVTSRMIADKFTGDQQHVSLEDSEGRVLKCLSYYGGEQASTVQWNYQIRGEHYIVELNESSPPTAESYITRWIYIKK